MLLLAAVLLLAMLAVCSPASAHPQYRGVQLHSLWWDSDNATMDRELDLAAGAGVNAVRVDVLWGEIEKLAPGQRSGPYTDKLDRFVAGARTRGIKVLANLWGTPCWASTAPRDFTDNCADQGKYWYYCGECWAPVDVGDYASIIRWLTARYGTDLAGVEVWNEPNWVSWHADDPAGAYARMLKAAYPAAKAGNASVPVVAGALSGSDIPFLQSLYAGGIKGFYDAFSIHPYADGNWAQLSAFRAAQLAAGDHTPLWITEFGEPTGSDPAWHVTEAAQADFVRGAFQAFDAMDFVAGAFVYALRDQADDPSYQGYNFGIVKRDFTPKLAYAALKEALAGPSGPPIVTQPPTTTTSTTTSTTTTTTEPPPTATTTASPPPVAVSTSPVTVAPPARPATTTPKRLTVTLRRVGKRLVARGRGAPARARVKVTVTGRSARGARVAVVRATASGSFTASFRRGTGPRHVTATVA
jgi:hypothetical protein